MIEEEGAPGGKGGKKGKKDKGNTIVIPSSVTEGVVEEEEEEEGMEGVGEAMRDMEYDMDKGGEDKEGKVRSWDEWEPKEG